MARESNVVGKGSTLQPLRRGGAGHWLNFHVRENAMAVLLATVGLFYLLIGPAHSLNNGLGLTPPMGWDTWCTEQKCGRDYCDAKMVMSAADAMATNGMKEAGYEYIIISDCWADHRAPDGTIVADKDRFPDGIEPVVKYVNSKGFKCGIYTDAGLTTCSPGGRPHTIPGSYGHYDQDAKTYTDWGIEYVKIDWCSSKVNGSALDPKVQYAEFSKSFNATGKPVFFNSCEWGVEDPWTWMGQYANSWRSGPDHHDSWAESSHGTASIIEHNADLGKYAGPGGWNDADFIYTGGEGCTDNKPFEHCPGQTDTEYRTEFSMWCIMGSSLLIATDIRNMTDIMKEVLLNKEMIDVNQDYPGKGGSRIGFWNCTEGYKNCQIWAKELHDGSYAIALYNAGSNTNSITFQFSFLNITGSVALRDLWAHKDLGNFTVNYTASVVSHGAEVYKLMKI